MHKQKISYTSGKLSVLLQSPNSAEAVFVSDQRVTDRLFSANTMLIMGPTPECGMEDIKLNKTHLCSNSTSLLGLMSYSPAPKMSSRLSTCRLFKHSVMTGLVYHSLPAASGARQETRALQSQPRCITIGVASALQHRIKLQLGDSSNADKCEFSS